MARTKIKKKMKNLQIISRSKRDPNEPYSTQWPNQIGTKNRPNDDGKIRDVHGTVLG